MWYFLAPQYLDLQPAQAALRTRFLWGVATKAPDCGSGSSPKKPSHTSLMSKPPDCFRFSTAVVDATEGASRDVQRGVGMCPSLPDCRTPTVTGTGTKRVFPPWGNRGGSFVGRAGPPLAA